MKDIVKRILKIDTNWDIFINDLSGKGFVSRIFFQQS